MSPDDLASSIENASCSIDGVAAIILAAVDSADQSIIERSTYACADLLARISRDLSDIGVRVRAAATSVADMPEG